MSFTTVCSGPYTTLPTTETDLFAQRLNHAYR